MAGKKAVVIGAGPAGLAAAYEFLNSTDIKPVLYEMTDKIGGISQTVDYKGYKIDFGPHRFFSKVNRVLDLWESMLPRQGAPAKDDIILERDVPLSRNPDAPDPEKNHLVMLYKNRITRILFQRKFFDYPISVKPGLFINLGLNRTTKIAASYLRSRLFPIPRERSLEDFFINRFGRELYGTFFKGYTEKVWGVSCAQLPPDWGSQRVKGVSIGKVLLSSAKKPFGGKTGSFHRKGSETSLIEHFLYPKFGAGQMYETIAKHVEKKGGDIFFNSRVTGVKARGHRIAEVTIQKTETGQKETVEGDYFFSTMPVNDLIGGFSPTPPKAVRDVAAGLMYRDYIQVGLLLNGMKLKNRSKAKTMNHIIPDNWIYVQETDVSIGRLDFFNNFSVYMLDDINKIWLGAEYFCSESDDIWEKSDKEMIRFTLGELEKIDLIDRNDFLDGVVLRMKKAYPSYLGTYQNFKLVVDFVNKFDNLFLVGRNGMHKYNNMDHSILSAMTAVDNIRDGVKDKKNLWSINTEEAYCEEK